MAATAGRSSSPSMTRLKLIDRLRRSSFFRPRLYRLGRTRAQRLLDLVEPYLASTDRILDLGCGTCNIAEVLIERGYARPTLLDVEDFSFVEALTPQLYDGSVIPFEDKGFDVVLLITVLHHTPDPERILGEAARVAKRVIIVEDVYGSFLGKMATMIMDSLSTLEFFGHPHSNKRDSEWKSCFSDLRLTLSNTGYSRFWNVFTCAVYDLST